MEGEVQGTYGLEVNRKKYNLICKLLKNRLQSKSKGTKINKINRKGDEKL